MIVLILLIGLIPATVISQAFMFLYEMRSIESDVQDITTTIQTFNHEVVTTGYLNGNASVSLEEQLPVLAQAYSGRVMLINSALRVVRIPTMWMWEKRLSGIAWWRVCRDLPSFFMTRRTTT